MDLHDEESGAKGVSHPMGRLALAGTCSRFLVVGKLSVRSGKRTRSSASLPTNRSRMVETRCRAWAWIAASSTARSQLSRPGRRVT